MTRRHIALSVLITATGLAATTASPQAMAGADVGRLGGTLEAVASSSATDVWAVGSRNQRPLVWHYDGTSWSQESLNGDGTLGAVAAVAADDVWAVGYTPQGPLIEHYNGAAWSKVDGAVDVGRLSGVTAASTDDVWVVGNVSESTTIEHWDGHGWTSVDDRQPKAGWGELYAADAFASDDVWAVGLGDTDEENGQFLPLTERFGGTGWDAVWAPKGKHNLDRILYGVSAVSSDDVWAVGTRDFSLARDGNLIDHWDGSRWTVVKSPQPGVGTGNGLAAVDAVSGSDAWTVGHFSNGASFKLLTAHWDGTGWVSVEAPGPGTGNGSFLEGVGAIATDNVWAVGHVAASTGPRILIEHWDGTAWTRVR